MNKNGFIGEVFYRPSTETFTLHSISFLVWRRTILIKKVFVIKDKTMEIVIIQRKQLSSRDNPLELVSTSYKTYLH